MVQPLLAGYGAVSLILLGAAWFDSFRFSTLPFAAHMLDHTSPGPPLTRPFPHRFPGTHESHSSPGR
jgi:hypothetical protein